jgi:hypothetical protein
LGFIRLDLADIGLVVISRIGDALSHDFGKDFSQVWAHEFGKDLAYHELGKLASDDGIRGVVSRFGVCCCGRFGVVGSG